MFIGQGQDIFTFDKITVVLSYFFAVQPNDKTNCRKVYAAGLVGNYFFEGQNRRGAIGIQLKIIGVQMSSPRIVYAVAFAFILSLIRSTGKFQRLLSHRAQLTGIEVFPCKTG